MVGSENKFSPTDLLKYADLLLKEAKLREANIQQYASNYSWLSSRHLQNEVSKTNEDLETLRPMIQKMSPENCAKIAVKLDDLTDGVVSSAVILSAFQKLLVEQYNMQAMNQNVTKAKDGLKKSKVNKVHPVLVPEGRQPTVSFILNI